MERQPLQIGLKPNEFLMGYYLLEELKVFCRQVGLATSGGKLVVSKRIVHYLETGRVLKPDKKAYRSTSECSLETIIVENLRYSEPLRAFFKQEIDSTFKFSVPFQRWLKANVGKTYADAIVAYEDIRNSKKITTIDKQFEYNTYIRDFFKDNKGKSLKEAIVCWNYKKQMLTRHNYEPSDLQALQDPLI